MKKKEIDLPYEGSYYHASLLGDHQSEKKIMSYRSSQDVFPSLPRVQISKGECEIGISYLNEEGEITNSVCLRKNRFSLGNVQFFLKMPVYEWDNIYHANAEIVKSGKFIAIPIAEDPPVYHLTTKKSFDDDEIGSYYSVYTNVYWNKYKESATLPYSLFERLPIREIIKVILEINK